MGYEAALNKAWEDLAKTKQAGGLAAKFLADEYDINIEARKVLSLSCNVPAKDFQSILILHYLAKKLTGLPKLTGDWLNFRELSGVEGYYPAFRKRAIEPIVRKYGSHPEGLLEALERFPAKKVIGPDVAIVVEAFQDIPVLIKLWRQDDEFGPDANMFFDKSIREVFCLEDIVVLGGLVASAL